jgi:YgiT-type zinc finger domain-containing protein
MSDSTIPEEPLPCRECSAGMMRLRFITYFTWLGEELITVQNFPAWICDVCGHREYDEKSISWLTMLLNPDAGKPTSKQRISHRTRPRPALRPPAES